MSEELFLLVFVFFPRSLLHEVSCVRSGAPGNPGGKKILRCYSFNNRFKVHYFLSICQLCAAGERRKKLRYLFLCRPILSGKKNLSSAAPCDPWVSSSRLEFTVVYGVIFRSGYTVTTLKTTWFWRKTSSFSNLNHYPVACTNRVGQQTSTVCFTRCKNASDADINACTLSGKHTFVLWQERSA